QPVAPPRDLHPFPTRRSSDLGWASAPSAPQPSRPPATGPSTPTPASPPDPAPAGRRPYPVAAGPPSSCPPVRRAISLGPHRSPQIGRATSELQSRFDLVCRLL